MRSHDDRWKIEAMPRWKQYRAIGNPPSKYRRQWRQEFRARANRAVRTCDPELLQIAPQHKVTCIYDWY